MASSGAILLVDASEGPPPQTRFLCRARRWKPDFPSLWSSTRLTARTPALQEVYDEVLRSFYRSWRKNERISFEFPVLYAIGRDGVAMESLAASAAIRGHFLPRPSLIKFPALLSIPTNPFQMLVADLDYSDYLGRLAVGRIMRMAACAFKGKPGLRLGKTARRVHCA